MAPNNVVKSAFIYKSDYDSPKELIDQNTIRTDFVLQNVYAHVIEPVASFEVIPAKTGKEKSLLPVLFEIIDDFIEKYRSALRNFCVDAQFELNSIGSYLQGVANELFCEGITWGRIVALFAFVGEFTAECFKKRLDYRVTDVIYSCFYKMVNENLTSWVEDHGGWDGVLVLSRAQESNSEFQSVETENFPLSNVSTKGWTKSFLYGTVRMIGTLAQIANTTQGYP